jgi:hypothetical protein
MARLSGQKGALYVAIASGGTAERIAFLTQWAINFATDRTDVTSFDDFNKTYVAGKPDSQGTFQGWYDDATAQTYTAAVDGVARKFYLYPDRDVNTKYWFGTGLFDFNVSAQQDGAVAITGSFAAASQTIKVG